MVAHKWAEVLRDTYVLGGRKTRGQSQRWPTRGQRCYITPDFSGVPKQGDKVKGGPQVGRSATPTLRSRRSPTEGDGNKGGQQQGGAANLILESRGFRTKGTKSPLPSRRPTMGTNCYITPTFSGVPNRGDKIRSGYLTLAFSGPTRGRNCYITPAFPALRHKGEKIRSGYFTHASSRAPKRAELLRTPYILGGPQQRGQN